MSSVRSSTATNSPKRLVTPDNSTATVCVSSRACGGLSSTRLPSKPLTLLSQNYRAAPGRGIHRTRHAPDEVRPHLPAVAQWFSPSPLLLLPRLYYFTALQCLPSRSARLLPVGGSPVRSARSSIFIRPRCTYLAPNQRSGSGSQARVPWLTVGRRVTAVSRPRIRSARVWPERFAVATPCPV